MDKSGARVGCPDGEKMVVLSDVVNLYAPSPENRKFVTIFETVYGNNRKPISLFIVYPRIKIMDTWIHNNLIRNEKITTSFTGYTNDTIIIEYLDHLIFHTEASNIKPWKLFLLDGHITHEYLDLIIKAHEYHIALHIFLSHLTHVLQSLDVGIFQPWKHYYSLVIQNAFQFFDFDYTIPSFF